MSDVQLQSLQTVTCKQRPDSINRHAHQRGPLTASKPDGAVVAGDGNYMESNCSDSDFFKNACNTYEKVVVFIFSAISASNAITRQQGVKLTLTK